MRILITGGNGYVGRELVRLLVDDHALCVVDRLRYGRIRIGAGDLARLRFERSRIEDGPGIRAIMDSFRPDAIIHLAAIHYIPECEDNAPAAVQTNVVGTVNLLDAAPSGCRFVFASSGAVYAPASEPHDEETSRLAPTDIYGLSKLHAEHYVGQLARKRSLRAVNVRLFNVVGPGETNPHLVPEIVAQLKSGRDRIRIGNLWPRRDYIHVRDAARGFAAAALNGEVAPGQTVAVNLGTSHAYSVAEILRKLRRISGLRFELEQDQGRVRSVDRPHLAASTARMRSLFGWEAGLTIDDALADLWSAPDLADRLTRRYASAQRASGRRNATAGIAVIQPTATSMSSA